MSICCFFSQFLFYFLGPQEPIVEAENCQLNILITFFSASQFQAPESPSANKKNSISFVKFTGKLNYKKLFLRFLLLGF